MCHGAKFHKNRLNRGRDMVIFIFFKIHAYIHKSFLYRAYKFNKVTVRFAATAMLDFRNLKF